MKLTVGTGEIEVTINQKHNEEGRTKYRYTITLSNGIVHSASNLMSGCHLGSIRRGMESLLAFLLAAVESYDYERRTGRKGENSELFPPEILAWASDNSDAISMALYDYSE